MTEQWPDDAEQIGNLVFVPNREYPYPFKVAVPPRFWMEEQTGVLEAAVDAYMNGERLDEAQLTALKLYLTQYVERAVMAHDANRQKYVGLIKKMRTIHDIESIADELAEYGAEVF